MAGCDPESDLESDPVQDLVVGLLLEPSLAGVNSGWAFNSPWV